MPFDSLGFEPVEVPVVREFVYADATREERLIELARLLENEQEWRNWLMVWDYGTELEAIEPAGRTVALMRRILYSNECNTRGCAIGLAATAWPGFRTDYDMEVCAMVAFGLSDAQTARIFYAGAFGGRYDHVTPGMVAHEIRKFLNRRWGQKRRGAAA